jgi:hypothetical protein
MAKKTDEKPLEENIGHLPGSHARWKGRAFKDRTDPRSHGSKAQGGPISRRFVDVDLLSVGIVTDPIPGYEFKRKPEAGDK